MIVNPISTVRGVCCNEYFNYYVKFSFTDKQCKCVLYEKTCMSFNSAYHWYKNDGVNLLNRFPWVSVTYSKSANSGYKLFPIIAFEYFGTWLDFQHYLRKFLSM